MNLVISGPIDATLRNMVVALSKPRRVVSLHSRADRMEGADDAPLVRQQVAALCDAARVDHAYIEEGLRFADFKLLAMDMDSTLITIECIDEIADYAGKKKEVAEITERAMRGEMDFAESLRQRVALLAGTDASVLRSVYLERVQLTEGSLDILAFSKQNEIRTLLLSGGFTYFSSLLCETLGFTETYANQLEIFNGKLTGNLIGNLIDGWAKREILRSHMNSLDLANQEILAIGDGANDIPMMSITSHSIAYRAKPITNDAARYQIKFGSLKTVLDYLNVVELA